MADRDCVHGQLARAEFEKWVKNPHMLGRCHAPGNEDRYEVSETQYAWRAWQAAIAAYRDAEIAALRTKLEAAERDAERYRKWKWWFREGEVGLWNAICEANSDAEHDAAIDAAQGGERG